MDLPGNSTMGPVAFKSTVKLRTKCSLADTLGTELLADRSVASAHESARRHSMRGREEDAATATAERAAKISHLLADLRMLDVTQRLLPLH